VVHETHGGFFEAGPARETGVTWICTGLSHYNGSFVIPALLAVALLVSGGTRTARPIWALFVQLGLGAAIVVYVIQVELLKHLFQRVETLLAEDTFTFALLALMLSAALRLGYRAVVSARRFYRPRAG
jgi:Kef-type K+ transport system membrane component KefB